MMVKLLQRLDTWTKPPVAALCLGIVGVVAWADYETGYETGFSIFYLTPVFIAAWYYGFAFGVLISVLSATAWMSMNLAAGVHFSSYVVPVWNATVKFTFYFVVVVLATKLHTLQQELESRVRERTAALNEEVQQRARLQKELVETAEREQRRISYDMHDGLCQHLTGTALASHVLGEKLADKSLPETTEANRVVELVEEAIELTRSLARGLDPIEVQTGQLADNFHALAVRESKRFNVACLFECPQAVPLNDVGVTTQLYRIAQEAVINAARHGKAKKIKIRLDNIHDKIVLTITDDGIGLPQDAMKSDGMGLRIMAYRADMIGATFHIERLSSLPGTRVTCTLAPKTTPKQHDGKN
jgi:signal transduction histidine kinase